MVRTEGRRQVSASVEPGSRALVIGGVGGPSIQRFVDHFVITAEFLLQDARPATIRRESDAGGIGVGLLSPRNGISEGHDADGFGEGGADQRKERKQAE